MDGVRVLRRRAVVLLAALAAAGVALFGSGPEPQAVRAAAIDVDLQTLVGEFATGRSTTVVQGLERRAASRPHDAALRTSLGFGYLQLFRETARPVWLSRARDALARAASLGNGDDALTRLGLAQLAATQHRFREAEAHARRALRDAPGNAAALGVLGDALLELGRYSEAFAAYDRAASRGPSVGAYARVARARELLGRPDGALDALQLAVEAGSGIREQEAWALTRYSGVLLDQGRPDDARVALGRALALEPGFPHALAATARVDGAAGRHAAAARKLEDLLRRVPSAEYATELGDVYVALGSESQARRAYRLARAFERRLARSGVRTLLASASLDLELGVRLPSALARARQAYREAPNLETEDLLAWALERNGRCHEARRWSERTFELGIRDATMLFHRGMIARCLGSPSAARWFREALEVDPAFSSRWAPVARRLARESGA